MNTTMSSKTAAIVTLGALASELRSFREQRGLTQEVLANISQVPLIFIRLCENPKGKTSEVELTQLTRVAFALGTKLSIKCKSCGIFPNTVHFCELSIHQRW